MDLDASSSSSMAAGDHNVLSPESLSKANSHAYTTPRSSEARDEDPVCVVGMGMLSVINNKYVGLKF